VCLCYCDTCGLFAEYVDDVFTRVWPAADSLSLSLSLSLFVFACVCLFVCMCMCVIVCVCIKPKQTWRDCAQTCTQKRIFCMFYTLSWCQSPNTCVTWAHTCNSPQLYCNKDGCLHILLQHASFVMVQQAHGSLTPAKYGAPVYSSLPPMMPTLPAFPFAWSMVRGC
jgi:hypothetical protein